MPLVNSFFEARSRGEFSFQNLSLSLTNSSKPIDWEALHAEAEDVRMDVWLDHCAHIHEIRHFHDLIGSVSGLHLFLEVTALVDNFFWILRQSGPEISLPLSPMNPRTKAAMDLHAGYKKFFSAVFGDDPLEIDTDEEEQETAPSEKRRLQTKQFKSAAPRIDTAYPLIPYHRLNPHTGAAETPLVPLGIRSLLEHLAMDIQLALAIIGAGPRNLDQVDKQEMRARGLRYVNAWAALYRREFVPYTVVRTVAGFHMFTSARNIEQDKKLDSLHTFSPALGDLIPLVQAALDIGGYAPIPTAGGHEWQFEHPGLIFGHLLSAWNGHAETSDSISLVNRVTQPFLNKTYTEFLACHLRLLETENLQSVLPPHLRPSAAFNPLIRTLREDIIADHRVLIRSKVADLNKWFDPVAYAENIPNLPYPPIVVGSDSPYFENSAKASRLLIWSFLLSFMEDIAGGKEITCPILETLSGLAVLLEVSDPSAPDQKTNCTPFIAARTCGRFNGSYLATQPQCPFVFALGLLRDHWGINVRSVEKNHG